MKLFGTLAILCALGGPAAAQQVTAAAPPRAPRFAVALDVETVWRLDDHYRLLADERAGTGVGFSASYDVLRASQGALALALGWHPERLERSFAGSQRADLDVDRASLSAVARWAALPWLEPHVRLSVAAAWGSLDLTLDDGARFKDRTVSPEGSAGAGFRLRSHGTTMRTLPGSPTVAFAASAEGGFTFGAPMRFEVTPPAPDDEDLAADRIPTRSIDVGSLDRAHPYMRLSVAVLF